MVNVIKVSIKTVFGKLKLFCSAGSQLTVPSLHWNYSGISGRLAPCTNTISGMTSQNAVGFSTHTLIIWRIESLHSKAGLTLFHQFFMRNLNNLEPAKRSIRNAKGKHWVHRKTCVQTRTNILQKYDYAINYNNVTYDIIIFYPGQYFIFCPNEGLLFWKGVD